jgi:hypothetical protein
MVPKSVPGEPGDQSQRRVDQRESEHVEQGQLDRLSPGTLTGAGAAEDSRGDRDHGIHAGCKTGEQSSAEQRRNSDERTLEKSRVHDQRAAATGG